jgi:hypothetical protein
VIIGLRRLLVGVVAFALVIAACGGDDDAGSGATTDAPVATTTAAPPASSNDDGGQLDIGNIFDGECQEAVAGVAAAMSAYTTGLARAFGGQLDEEELQATADQLRALAESAPDELKGDLDVIAAALAEFYGAFGDIGFDPSGGQAPTAEQIQQLTELSEQFDDTGFQEAADNVTAWFEANCN